MPPASVSARAPRPGVRRAAGPAAAGWLVLGAAAVSAQGVGSGAAGGGGTGLRIVPSVSLTQTFTSNVALSSTDSQSDAITQLSPGVRLSSSTGRIRGDLAYALNAVAYARDSGRNELQNTLAAAVNAEAIENWAFVDFSANVSQQSISAFGAQTVDPTLGDANRTEVASYSLSPYIQGGIGRFADYEVRLTRSASSSGSGGTYDTSTDQFNARLNGGTAFSVLGWFATASRQDIDYSTTGKNRIDRARAGLSYALTPELSLSANAGRERNDLLSGQTQSGTTHGFGFSWRPTVRTSLVAEQEQRLFGSTHDIRLEHRTPRTVWSFSDVRGVTTGNGRSTAGNTYYDLFYAQLASLQPDPTLRAQLAEQLLRAAGLGRNTVAPGGFLSSSALLDRTQRFGFAWLGLRDTLALSASRSRSQVLDTSTGRSGDFAAADVIRQLAVTVDLSHRLTPQSSVNVSLSNLKSSGTRSTGEVPSSTLREVPSSTLRVVSVGWATTLGARTSASVGGRYSKSTGSSAPYDESAVFGTIRREF